MRPEEDGTPQEVMERAIRRLGVLEYLFLGLAAIAALVAGALVAWLLQQEIGWNFRVTWAATAMLLFLIPGFISWWRVRKDEQTPPSNNRDRS